MSYVIRGLEPAQNYEAKVQARNRYGWSPISEPFTFQTADADMTYPERPQSAGTFNENEIRDLGIRIYSSTSDGGAATGMPFAYTTLLMMLVLPLIFTALS
ncbi:hypothetical protein Trydic_g5872 [Trypoxylus dichotomus]